MSKNNENIKHQNNDKVNNQVDKKETKNHNKQEFKYKELYEHELKKNKELQNINTLLKDKNKQLEEQISQLNQDFIKQLETKAKQAQQILEQKVNELEARHEAKVNDAVFKIFKFKMEPLLDAINHFTKIVNQNYDDPKIQAFIEGFKMFSQNMIDGLDNLKITKISPQVNDSLNDEIMEVFEVVENTNKPSMHVVEVISDGFKYNDKVIKFAVVKVAK
ncbi:MAG: nucleotide exchange factor GrpE [Ureaplasma parvum]|nr:nucleotide exchange factor GrpE [Ureaplasma parvum]MBS5833411.1 nucleotide exchange factor GrpE [Ureaplasma parvum]